MNARVGKYSGAWVAAALIAVFAALAVLSAAVNGIPFGNDLTQHYQFAASIEEALTRGEIYPSLSPLANSGLGDYGLRFYPPLGYYLLAICYKIVGGWFGGSILAFFLIYFLGGTGVYLWAREGFGQQQSLIAAALYVFAPYHLNQIYNNFLYGEVAATAVIPFCFLFLHRTVSRPGIGPAVGLAAAYALLILTHLPSIIYCSAALAVYGIVLMVRIRRYVRPMAFLAGAVAAALASTSFFWIKLVTELEWINHAREEYFSEIYGYANNFLLRPSNILGAREDVLAIWMADLMLAVALFVCIPAAILLWKERALSPPIVPASGAILLFAAFMSSVLSKPVWDIVAPLQKVQFPWRWLGLVSIAAAVFASYGVSAALKKEKATEGTVFRVALLASVVLFTFSAVFVTKQSVFILPADFSDEKVRAMLTGQSRDCWWTVWAGEGFYRLNSPQARAGDRRVTVTKWDALERTIKVGPGDEKTLTAAIQYYPHWRAYVGERRVPTGRDKNGLLTAEIPNAASDVTLRFREPDTVRAASAVSAAGWAAIIFSGLFSLTAAAFSRKKKAKETGLLEG